MNADHLSYQRAASVSLIGLALQLLFALAFLLYGIFGRDPAGVSAALAAMLGIPIWVGLALVFHQHRLERLEAMEAEAYADSSAAQASVFEEAAASDASPQANKLAWMHKWFLPVLSILIGAGYIVIGVLRFLAYRNVLEVGEWTAPEQGGWGISIGVAVAVIGFVFARFVAGMAKQSVWSLLNAGAASVVGASLLGILLFVAHFAAEAISQDLLIRYLPLAIDVLMIALGVEIAINFVLTLYRPRKPGEYLRPALDSRFLAFLAAPDRLAESISEAVNYQFGFNVSSTWFYRLVSRSLSLLVLLGLLVGWFLTSFAVVEAGEKGLLLRSGSLVRTVEPGLVFKRPWPFDRVVTFPADRVNTLTVGASFKPEDPNAPLLWTTATGADEQYIVVHASAVDDAGPDLSLALMAAEIPVHYVVTDLQTYLRLAQDGPASDRDRIRQDLLQALASRVVTRVLSRYAIDEILGPQRPGIAASLQTEIQAAFDAAGAGVQLTFTGIQGVRPPREVAESFESVVAADRKKEAAIQSARAAAIIELGRVAGDVELARRILDELESLESLKRTGATREQITAQEQRITELIVEAGGQAAVDVSEARKDRWVRLMGQRALATRYEGQLEAYRAAPRAYIEGIYMDALHEVLSTGRVWISAIEVPDFRLDQTELNVDITGAISPDLENQDEE